MSTDAISGVCYAGADPLLMARIAINDDGDVAYIMQANIDTITFKVYYKGTQVGIEGTIDKTNAIHDTLQTGDVWTETIDATGGNFEYQIDGSTYLAVKNRTYTVTVWITLTGGTIFPIEFAVATRNPSG